MPAPQQRRRDRLRHELEGRDIDVALVTDLVNVR